MVTMLLPVNLTTTDGAVLSDNGSMQSCDKDHDNRSCHVTSGLIKIIVSVLLAMLIAGIIAGNLLVIISVALFDKMRTLSNGLIASLASADLLVAVAVLPISLQVSFKPILCFIFYCYFEDIQAVVMALMEGNFLNC